MNRAKPKNIKRVVVYEEQERYRKLSAKLRAQGSDVSKWFREKVDDELKQ